MNYVLSESAARKLSALLKDAAAVVPAANLPRRTSRPDVPPGVSAASWWQVRYDETDGWLVRIVSGKTVTLEGARAQNVRVGNTEWYKIAGVPTGDGTFGVVAHVKRAVRRTGETSDAPAIFVSASSAANAYAGDEWSAVIATCSVSTDDETEETSREVVRGYSGQVDFLPSSGDMAPLRLYWATVAPGSTGADVFTPHVAPMQDAPICGGSLADVQLGASGNVTAYYLIDCTGSEPSASVVTSPETATGKVNIAVYHLSGGRVVDDMRSELSHAVFYP